jgi:hypothetical protein
MLFKYMEWRAYVKHTWEEMKASNPSATLKQAMIASSEGWKKTQHGIYGVRGDIVKEERKKAKGKKKPAAEKAAHSARADRVEAAQYGGVLNDMRTVDEWY